jgi:hypothetical protein
MNHLLPSDIRANNYNLVRSSGANKVKRCRQNIGAAFAQPGRWKVGLIKS